MASFKDTVSNAVSGTADALESYLTGQGTVDAANAQIAAAKELAAKQREAGGQAADLIGLAGNQGQGQLYDAFQGSLAAILGGAPLPGMSAPGDYTRWENTLKDLYQSQPLEVNYGERTQAPGLVQGAATRADAVGGMRGGAAMGGATPSIGPSEAPAGVRGVAPGATTAPRVVTLPVASSGRLSTTDLAALLSGRR